MGKKDNIVDLAVEIRLCTIVSINQTLNFQRYNKNII